MRGAPALAWRIQPAAADPSPNEGCNAYFVSAVLAGGPLYFPPDALLTNNYPPLSFYLVAPLAGLIGDAVFAGRLMAWLAFAAIVALRSSPFRIGATATCSPACSVEYIFAGYMVIDGDIYVGMDDPQVTGARARAVRIVLGGSVSQAAWSSIAAGVLMAAGLFVKHNVLALPLTLALWLAIYDRRAAMRFICSAC